MKPTDIYQIAPLSFVAGIPVFSELNEYIANYEKIARDHLCSAEKTGSNPFINEDDWIEFENSTKQIVLKYGGDINGKKIMDVGVGLGRLLSALPEGFDKYGMDISIDYLKVAKSKNIEVCMSMVEDMPYRSELFDMIICTDVLEHVLDLNLACKKILGSLKKGGMLIIRVPYREDLSNYLASDYPYKYAHLRNFDENTLTLLFEQVFGCKMVECVVGVPVMQDSLLKFKLPAFIHRIVFFGIKQMKSLNHDAYDFLRGMCYKPCVINCAVLKPMADKGI